MRNLIRWPLLILALLFLPILCVPIKDDSDPFFPRIMPFGEYLWYKFCAYFFPEWRELP